MCFLIALHLLRNPAGRWFIDSSQSRILRERIPRYTERWGIADTDAFVEVVTSDAFRADVLLRSLPRLAAVAGNMDWTLLEFSDFVLATSDHPVTVVPILRPSETARVQPITNPFVLECEEIRIAIGPKHALLLTWGDGANEGQRVTCGEHIAAQLNRAVMRQADTRWFHYPARRPTTFIAPVLESNECSPVGGVVFPGYGWRRARGSRKRIGTWHTIQDDLNERTAA